MTTLDKARELRRCLDSTLGLLEAICERMEPGPLAATLRAHIEGGAPEMLGLADDVVFGLNGPARDCDHELVNSFERGYQVGVLSIREEETGKRDPEASSSSRRSAVSDAPMQPAQRTQSGKSIEDLLEARAGCPEFRLVELAELSSAVYAVAEEFAYDEEEPAVDLVRLCRGLQRFLEDVSVTEGGTLTLNRQCARCSGAGRTKGENPCIECGGLGHVHASEANG
jgi:hypothetical protein